MNSNNQSTTISSNKKSFENFLTKQNFKNANNAIEQTISKPRTIDIARRILEHETCHIHKQRNNIFFLDSVEVFAKNYVDTKFEFDDEHFFKNIKKYSEGYDPEIHNVDIDQYALNRYIESNFIKIDESLDDIENKREIFHKILNPHSIEEIKRVGIMLDEIFRIYIFKSIALIAYESTAYELCLNYHDFAMYLFAGSAVQIGYDRNDYFEKMASLNGTIASEARWAPQSEYRQQKKKEYLAIMKEQGFKKYAETARYIKEYIDTDEKPTYEYVYKLISEAAKGNLS